MKSSVWMKAGFAFSGIALAALSLSLASCHHGSDAADSPETAAAMEESELLTESAAAGEETAALEQESSSEDDAVSKGENSADSAGSGAASGATETASADVAAASEAAASETAAAGTAIAETAADADATSETATDGAATEETAASSTEATASADDTATLEADASEAEESAGLTEDGEAEDSSLGETDSEDEWLLAETEPCVGDVLLCDGRRLSRSQLDAASALVAQTGVAAVIAYLTDDGYVAAGIPLSESYQWAKAGSAGASKIISAIGCSLSVTGSGAALSDCTFSGDIDGSDNWQAVTEADSDAASSNDLYPAFSAVASYASERGLSEDIRSGWYLPAIAELYAVYQNLTEINETLSSLGLLQLTESYWSSTCPEASENTDYIKSAWYLNFSKATMYNVTKTTAYAVLPLCKF
ncbi:MAG: hypothetical protein K6G80_11035 [Treponema sp.]|nr:hypothetical protein [Treponema sp.]